MTKRIGGLALTFALSACGDDIPDATSRVTFGTAAETSGSSTAADVASSDGSTAGPVPEVVLELRLALELRSAIDVTFATVGDALVASIEVGRDYGVVATDLVLEGPARIDLYPEVGATLYTARLAGPAIPEGPCGAQPVSLALALHSEEGTDFIAGGLTAYCGADRWFGVPVVEPLRISGRIEQESSP